MTQRAHAGVLITDADGDIQANTAVTITKADGSALGQSLFAAQAGGSSTTTHVTDSGGRLDRFVPIGDRALFTPATGTARIVDFHPHPADIVVQGATVPVLLDGYDGTSASLEIQPLDDVNAYALRVRDDGGSDILRVRKSAAGRNLILFGDDGSLPETALVHAYQSLDANNQYVVNLDAFVGTSGIVGVGGLNVTATQTIAGTSNTVAIKALAVRGAATSASESVAVKGWLDIDIAPGQPKLGVSFWASSIGAQAADTAFLADGSANYTDHWRGYNAADTLTSKITAAGAATFVSVVTSAGISGANITAFGSFIGVSASSAATPSLFLTGGAAGVAGMYSGSANVLGIGTNSVERIAISTTAITTTLPAQAGAGSAGTPSWSFSADPDSGLYSTGTNVIRFSTGGTLAISIDANGLLEMSRTGTQNIANGGGAAATLGTIGATSPTIAAQSGWVKFRMNATDCFLPYWV